MLVLFRIPYSTLPGSLNEGCGKKKKIGLNSYGMECTGRFLNKDLIATIYSSDTKKRQDQDQLPTDSQKVVNIE